MNMKDPEEMKLVEKLEEELFEHKMMFEDLRRQLIEVNNEQKQQRTIQEAQIKKREDLEMIVKQQSEEIKSGIASLLELMKKQQQPQDEHMCLPYCCLSLASDNFMLMIIFCFL